MNGPSPLELGSFKAHSMPFLVPHRVTQSEARFVSIFPLLFISQDLWQTKSGRLILHQRTLDPQSFSDIGQREQPRDCKIGQAGLKILDVLVRLSRALRFPRCRFCIDENLASCCCSHIHYNYIRRRLHSWNASSISSNTRLIDQLKSSQLYSMAQISDRCCLYSI